MSLFGKISIIILCILCALQLVRKTIPLFRKISTIILCILCALQLVFSNQGKTGITAILSIVTLCCMIGSDVIYSNKKKKEQYRKEFNEKYQKGENYLDRD